MFVKSCISVCSKNCGEKMSEENNYRDEDGDLIARTPFTWDQLKYELLKNYFEIGR